MEHITQAKRKLKQLLLDRLPAQLMQADLEAADGVRTPPPHVIYTTNRQDLEGYPAVEIHGQGSAQAADSDAQVYAHRLILAITVAGDDEDTLATQSERYIYAIRQIARLTLLAPDVPTGPLTAGPEEYTPAVPRPPGLETPFVKGAFLEVSVTTVE